MADAPDPTVLHPLAGHDRVVFLKPLVRSPKIEVGEYTYYDDPEAPEDFEGKAVLYAYGPERLIIGRFCAIAAGVRFLLRVPITPIGAPRPSRSGSSAPRGLNRRWT